MTLGMGKRSGLVGRGKRAVLAGLTAVGLIATEGDHSKHDDHTQEVDLPQEINHSPSEIVDGKSPDVLGELAKKEPDDFSESRTSHR